MIKQLLRWLLAVSLVFSLLVPVARAQANERPFVEKMWHGIYDVDADGRTVETIVSRIEVLHEAALEHLKVYQISYSTSIQTGEILEAYTIKKDGRQVAVPPGNYQKQTNDGQKGAGPMFSDRTSISVVFPDLAVGDTVHVRYSVAEKEPMFPGRFSLALDFSPFSAYEDSRVVIRAPRSLPLRWEAHFFKAEPEKEADGKRVLEWRYANPKPRAYDEEADRGLWTQAETPSVLVSTFSDYEGIAKAYGDRALPKAQPTPRIRELARSVLGQESRPREQARLLYEWVSRTITYGGNCIGVGAVVPRDLDVVLDNKMGDCKDHATLLQAMLAAAGIHSEQVLINAGDQYELARTPVVSLVNHVMNYLPQLDLYVDATAKDVPFGLLPQGAYGKPVIHVGAAKALAVVPHSSHQSNEQRLRMTLKLAANGSATGTLEVSLKGQAAASARAYMREMTQDADRDFVRRTLSARGYKGRGTLVKGDTAGLSDSFRYSLTFEIDNFLQGGPSGAFVLAPVISSPLSVMNLAGVRERAEATRRSACRGFHSHETYEIELPGTLTILDLPSDARVRGRWVDFTAMYKKTDTGLSVARELHDATPVSICSAAEINEFNKQAAPIGENLRTQVLYRRKSS